MRRARGSLKKYYPQIKEMRESGMEALDIANALGLEKQTVNNIVSIMGLQKKRPKLEEKNLVYAIKTAPVLEKVLINGKRYIDITPIFAPR